MNCYWTREINRQHDLLERIITLLFFLAGLADCAAGLSARRRSHMLGHLACGEAEARVFVIELAGASVEGDAVIGSSASVSDAERLAVSFRVLALVLGAMLAQARRSAFAGEACRCVVLAMPDRKPAGPAQTRQPSFQALPAPDTS